MGNNQPNLDAHAFATRLNEALDEIEGVPARGEGRGSWLAQQFKVTEGTTNGWLTGRFMPKPDRVRRLATRAGVSYDWLYFGVGGPKNGTIVKVSETDSPVYAQSQPVRDESLTIALRLAAEAIGRDLYLPPREHTDLVLTVLDLLNADMPEAEVLPIAKRLAARLAHGGSDGTTGKGSKT